MSCDGCLTLLLVNDTEINLTALLAVLHIMWCRIEDPCTLYVAASCGKYRPTPLLDKL